MISSVTSPDDIRAHFSAAMSAMYRAEVPAYGTLVDLVAKVNSETLRADPALHDRLVEHDDLARISDERHGAIRLGTPGELAMMGRVFAVMGMFPVGYYDLSEAGVPVHSTAFRPVDAGSLRKNPFRVFTSLLRLDLIADDDLRAKAAAVLSTRKIFSDDVVALVEHAEAAGGLIDAEASRFISGVLDTFRWHDKAIVSADLYMRLHDAHRLVADVVSFRGPHINHLTPRTLDIDAVQARMPDCGITPKAIVEGPPTRRCPILLRQTSFKALDEEVEFFNGTDWVPGQHSARFGEIEQRGVALTPKGRALYDGLLNAARQQVRPAADGSNADAYMAALSRAFAAFPDDWSAIRTAELGYFTYSLTPDARPGHSKLTADEALTKGLIRFDPLIYEDFLPVSAAGIFQSNLGDDAAQEFAASPNQKKFEAHLGMTVLNEFDHYAAIEAASLQACLTALF